MTTVTYKIPNISCAHCVHTIKTEMRDLAGVQSVEADQFMKTATIVFDTPASEDQVKQLLAEINYPAAN